VRSRRL